MGKNIKSFGGLRRQWDVGSLTEGECEAYGAEGHWRTVIGVKWEWGTLMG